ncbi:hypothetical protein R5R35_005669 [Gryllus longicercus]|uniref:non-specific serine/threonine protein kinase n=1 Tax=Gryllus longicercus TaxID=2509291 RepID=A0AAN9VQI2_9ORTH
MSKFNLPSGIILSCDQNGLLTVAEEHLENLMKKDPLSNIYIVEHTPFARGKFAAVRKCTHRETGVEYAAKFIRKRRRAMDQRADILHEVAVLTAAAGSSRIVTLHEVYETATEMALILELAAGGELQHVLDVQEGLEELQAARFMKQILQGLGFLHNHNIAHLDLKPQNLLLTGNYPDCDVKLCDFGISRVIQNGVEVREILGTPDYVAPEVLSYEPISLATDIWSVGVLAYVLVSGFSPFGGDSKQETFLNISKCKLDFPEELFQNVSKEAQDFIRATLHIDPRKRPSIENCLSHPWMCSVADRPCLPLSCSEEVIVAVVHEDDKESNGFPENIKANDDNCQEEKINNNNMSDTKDERGSADFGSLGILRSFTQNFKEKSTSRSLGEENGNNANDDVVIISLKEEEENIPPSLSNSKEDFEGITNGHSKNEISSHFILKSNAKHDSTIGASGTDSEEDKDSPVNKRPKNCLAGRRSSFPVVSCLSCAQCGSQCCHHSAPHSPDLRLNQRHHNGIANSPVEITPDRSIIC